ncbi:MULTISPECIES: VOC family protein [unclassified Mycobacterium]|uniref:VOC family protein n=1 Tax=unclassified Mycobacterium TaxID=2642494 RepID=UPI000A6388C6|nr:MULTISPECIES: VOC family protein [unclassified Mycobacterium]
MINAQVAVQATRFLHVNLNTALPDASVNWYTSQLGLRVGMKTLSRIENTRGMGFDHPTEVNARFAFDHRGGRRALALEIVEWLTPPTVDYGAVDHEALGIAAIGFLVPTAHPLFQSSPRTRRLLGNDGEQLVAATVVDPDGVHVELVADPTVEAPEFSYARINTHDIGRSVAFYETIGFTPRGGRRNATWQSAAGPGRAVEIQALRLPGGADFSLQLTTSSSERDAGRTANARGLFRIALAVDDIEAAVKAARASHIEASDPAWVPLPDTPREGIDASFFSDPQGVMVEFVGVTEAAVERRP